MRVETVEVGKRFGKVWALRDLSVLSGPGSIEAIVGPNGAGKTTWMRLLAGVSFPTKGRVLLDGRPFDREDVALRRRLFFLPDMLAALGEHTPLRHASMVIHLYGREVSAVQDRLMETYEQFDLLPHVETPLVKLSRGQFYKSILAAAVAVEPELWLIDEPFAAGMDPEGMEAFRRMARAAASRGTTILFTTQILEIAEKFANTIHVLHQGKLAVSASPQELADSQGGDAQQGILELLQTLREGR